MDKTIPFFYYDILSRVIPGAVTLVVFSVIESLPPISWLLSLTSQFAHHGWYTDGQGWQTIAIPIVLLGLCYLIGTLYEVFDHSIGIKQLLDRSEDEIFRSALEKDGQPGDSVIAKRAIKEVTKYRYALWEKITLEGSSDPKMSLVFAHCHRYQAEHKMFLHLIYPSLLLTVFSLYFAVFSFANPYTILNCLEALSGICLLSIGPFMSAMLFYASEKRNERRWLQVVIFCRQLGWRRACVVRCFPRDTDALGAGEPSNWIDWC
jgi:hypothetical protein